MTDFKALHEEFEKEVNDATDERYMCDVTYRDLGGWVVVHAPAILAALELAQQVGEMDRSRIAAIEDRIEVTERLSAENASLKHEIQQWFQQCAHLREQLAAKERELEALRPTPRSTFS